MVDLHEAAETLFNKKCPHCGDQCTDYYWCKHCGDITLLDEYQDDQLVLYLEVARVTELQTLAVSNRILFSELEGQQNIVRIKTPTKRKSFLQTQGRARDLLHTTRKK